MGGSRTPSRDCSVPCRLLHETPAHVQGGLGGWSVLAILPGALCTDVSGWTTHGIVIFFSLLAAATWWC